MSVPGSSTTPATLFNGQDPSVSANAQLVAFIRGGDVWVATRDGGFQRQVTDTDVVERSPAFSPNGRSIVFSTELSDRNGRVAERGNIVRIQSAGTDRRKLTDTGRIVSDPSFSPDGNKIVFSRTGTDATPQIWKMASDGSDPGALTDAQTASDSPSWSPKFVDQLVGDRIHRELMDFTDKVRRDPNHELRQSATRFLFEFADDLQHDPATIARAESA